MTEEYAVDVTVADGKYRLVQHKNGNMEAFRYGEKWRDLTGDGMVLALMQEIEELRTSLDNALETHHGN